MIPLTYEDNKSYEEQEVCYICKKFCSDENDENNELFKLIKNLKNT